MVDLLIDSNLDALLDYDPAAHHLQLRRLWGLLVRDRQPAHLPDELPFRHPPAPPARVAVDRLLCPCGKFVGIRRQRGGPAEHDSAAPNSDYAVSKVAAANLIYYYGKRKHFPVRQSPALLGLRPAGRLFTADSQRDPPRGRGQIPRVCQPGDLARFYLRRRCHRGVRRHGLNLPGRLRRVVQHRHRPEDDHRRGRRDGRKLFGIAGEPHSPCPNAPGTSRTGTPTSRRPGRLELEAADDFEEGLKQTIAWYQALPDKARYQSRPRNSASTPSTASARSSLLQGQPGDPDHVRAAQSDVHQAERRFRDHLRQRLQLRTTPRR